MFCFVFVGFLFVCLFVCLFVALFVCEFLLFVFLFVLSFLFFTFSEGFLFFLTRTTLLCSLVTLKPFCLQLSKQSDGYRI